MKILQKVFCLFLFISLSGCVSTNRINENNVRSVEDLTPDEIVWSEVTESQQDNCLFYCEYFAKSENIKWACVKVDLYKPWNVVAEPEIKNLGKKFFLNDFSQKYNTLVSINTVPFRKEKKSFFPISIVKINGEIISPLNERYCALGLKKQTVQSENLSEKTIDILCASIVKNQNEHFIEEFDYVFGGYFVILEQNKVFEYEKYRNARSAIGISEDGRFLYFFGVCGVNDPFGNSGMSYEECALVMRKLGCYSAMEFDGGHSAGLMVKNKELIKPALQTKIPAAFGLCFP